MQHRVLGRTGIAVSELGLGCQSLGGGLYHGGRRKAIELAAAAVDAGVTFFDTSDHYSLGLSEVYLGAALRGRRHGVVLASKAGTTYSPWARVALGARPAARLVAPLWRPFKLKLHHARARNRHYDFSAGYLRAACEASLRRLQTDHVDLLQLHKPPAHVLASDEVRSTLQDLQTSGKTRAIGVACDSAEDALMAIRTPWVSVIQVTLNLLEQATAALVLPEAMASGVGVIGRNPRAQGHLGTALGDATAETYARDSAEVRARSAHASHYQFLTEPGRTLGQAALQYVLQLRGVSVVTPRVLDMAQLRETIAVSGCPPLSPTELRQIEATDRSQSPGIGTARYRSG